VCLRIGSFAADALQQMPTAVTPAAAECDILILLKLFQLRERQRTFVASVPRRLKYIQRPVLDWQLFDPSFFSTHMVMVPLRFLLGAEEQQDRGASHRNSFGFWPWFPRQAGGPYS